MFEAAEVRYRSGEYEAALDGYKTFLEQYPESPLAEVAEMRIRTMKREVASMLGRSEMPRPIYRRRSVDAAQSADSVKPLDAEPSAQADEGE